MPDNTKVLHHYHKRTRKNHVSKAQKFMDKSIYAIGIAGPLLTFPQLLKIWLTQTAAGVSIISWFGYLLVAILWVIYGVMHKNKPIIVTYMSWALIEVFIVLGIILYS